MGVETAIGLGLLAASAGVQHQNTRRTEKKQDNALAESIRNQSAKQRQVGERVDEEVGKLAGSTSEGSRREALDNYVTALRRNKTAVDPNYSPGVGSSAFREDSAAGARAIEGYGADTASLMARMDAPSNQRRGEAFGYGNLATDINLISREAQGQNFLDELRLRAIRRSPGLDLASSLMGSAGGAMLGGGFGAAKTGGNALGASVFGGMPTLGQMGY